MRAILSPPKSLSVSTVAMLLVAVIFGMGNVTDNLAALGLSAIPSWVAVGILYFLPLSLMMAELGSATPDRRGGIYSYMEVGIGPTWAFVGTWAYFVSNLAYLQMVCSRMVISASLAITGRDVFEGVTWLVPFLGAASCIAMTWIATRGVHIFSRFAGAAGRWVLFSSFGLILVALGAVATGLHEPATVYHAADLVPKLDLQYFSTFAWLLFAVSGAEGAGPYVHDMRDPERSFPRAIVSAAVLVGGLYVLGTVGVSVLIPAGSINKATAVFDSWHALGALLNLPAEQFARFFMSAFVLVSIAGYIVWMDSPIRAMFADVPRGTFPAFLTHQDTSGSLRHALWTQAAVVCALIFVPLFSILTGLSGSDRLISLLNDLTSLSIVVPYLFVSVAYIRVRRAGMKAPFQMVRSTPLAVGIGVLTFVLSALGYVGAGLYALDADRIDWIYVATVYLGPGLLIVLGLALRRASLRRAASAA